MQHLYTEVPLSEVPWSSQHSRGRPACLLLLLVVLNMHAADHQRLRPAQSGASFLQTGPDEWNPVSRLRTYRCVALSGTASELIHDAPPNTPLAPPPSPKPARLCACCSATGLDWLLLKLERKCANLQPDPGEGRSQEQAFGPFTSRIHHQRWTRAHLG